MLPHQSIAENDWYRSPLDREEQEILKVDEAGTLRSVATASERSRLESSVRANQTKHVVSGRQLVCPGSGEP
jgi:hypothetical protein